MSHTLRLFHPFLPFITEELWHGMGYHEDMPEDQGGKTIMFAPWPKPFDDDFRDHYSLDDCYVEFVNSKHELVSQGRNLRREANIPANKKVKFIFKPGTGVPAHDIKVLQLLLNAEQLEVGRRTISRRKARRQSGRNSASCIFHWKGCETSKRSERASRANVRNTNLRSRRAKPI